MRQSNQGPLRNEAHEHMNNSSFSNSCRHAHIKCVRKLFEFSLFQIHHYRHHSHHPPCTSAKCLTSAHSSARFGWITRSWHVQEDGQGLQGTRSERFPDVALHEHRPRCWCESDASAWRHTQGLWRTCCRPDIGTSGHEPSGSSHLQPWMSGSIVREHSLAETDAFQQTSYSYLI